MDQDEGRHPHLPLPGQRPRLPPAGAWGPPSHGGVRPAQPGILPRPPDHRRSRQTAETLQARSRPAPRLHI